MNNLITNPIKHIVCPDYIGKITGEETMLQVLKLFTTEAPVQEYCFTKDYPNLRLLQSISSVASLFNVFIDKVELLLNPKKVFAFGDSVISIVTTGHTFCTVAATHDTLINIEALESSIVSVELYKEAKCLIKKGSKGKVHIINK